MLTCLSSITSRLCLSALDAEQGRELLERQVRHRVRERLARPRADGPATRSPRASRARRAASPRPRRESGRSGTGRVGAYRARRLGNSESEDRGCEQLDTSSRARGAG